MLHTSLQIILLVLCLFGTRSAMMDENVRVDETCDCDERGTVPNTVCDPGTQQCTCKNNVQGRRCSACRDGYFHLRRDNEMGCQACFCSGITSQCSSSNYYRQEIPMMNADGSHNIILTNRRLSRTINDGFTVNAERREITFPFLDGIQRYRETLFFSLPAKFRGDKVSAYGGYLKFSIGYVSAQAQGDGHPFIDVDVEIISDQDKRFYMVFNTSPTSGDDMDVEIHLTENSFRPLQDRTRWTASREEFITALSDIDAILIRATYDNFMRSVTLRDLRMEIAVPGVTGLRQAPEVESCVCPQGYTGLSCQACAPGYNRVENGGVSSGRCVSSN